MDPVQMIPARARAYVGWLVVLGTALAVAALVLPAGAQDDDQLENPVAFAETSYANVCAECHGGDGSGGRVPGTDAEGPALTDRDDVTAAYLDLVLRTGRMPPPGDPFDNRAREVYYTDAERAAMVAWMVDQFDLESDIPDVGEGDVSDGLETFALHCAHCHGNAGSGGVAGQRAWTPDIHGLEPVAIAEAIRVGPFEMPAFSGDQLTDDDVDDVATYLQAVESEEGTPLLGLVELNPVFASGFVGLVAVALLGALLFIGGRPQPFEHVPSEEIEAEIEPPVGKTPMPGDPEYDAAVGADREHEPVPYTDEGKDDRGTSDEPEATTADEAGRDQAGGPAEPDGGDDEEGL